MSRLSSYTDLGAGSDLETSSLSDLYPPAPVPSAWSRVVPPPGDESFLVDHPLADLGRPNTLAPIKGSASSRSRVPPTPLCKASERELGLAQELRARLYNRPEQSQVLMAVKRQSNARTPSPLQNVDTQRPGQTSPTVS